MNKKVYCQCRISKSTTMYIHLFKNLFFSPPPLFFLRFLKKVLRTYLIISMYGAGRVRRYFNAYILLKELLSCYPFPMWNTTWQIYHNRHCCFTLWQSLLICFYSRIHDLSMRFEEHPGKSITGNETVLKITRNNWWVSGVKS